MSTNFFIKTAFAGLLCTVFFFGAAAQDLSGAWKLITKNGKAFTDESIKIYSDGYFMYGVHAQNGAFISAGGGKYQISGKEYREIHDFNTQDNTVVRKPQVYSFTTRNDELTITMNTNTEIWKKVDQASTALSGAWRFGARVDENGQAGERRGADLPRQTMKILSGKYFQWAAFNFETKEFFGTGGGTYQRKDNQYTETIRFFSRDNSRVGMSLTFECRIDGNDWFHKGKGTTGNPVSEVWERAEQ